MVENDLGITASKLRPEAVSEAVKAFNKGLAELTKDIPPWYKVGAAKYREMSVKGSGIVPPPVMLDGTPFAIPSREQGRTIPCRVMRPDGDVPIRGVFMHIHGGGWVLSSETVNDPNLKAVANATGLLAISVGYRLAPEDPFPKGPEDCYDAADWLADNAQREFGGTLKVISGDSAGAHLSVLAALHLLKSRPDLALSCLLLLYGAFNLTGCVPWPANSGEKLMLPKDNYDAFVEAFTPGFSVEQRKDPAVSPYFADVAGLPLPAALFAAGTDDLLLGDSVAMALKWQMAGAEGVLKLYPGCVHGFTTIAPPEKLPEARECFEHGVEFIREKIGWLR